MISEIKEATASPAWDAFTNPTNSASAVLSDTKVCLELSQCKGQPAHVTKMP